MNNMNQLKSKIILAIAAQFVLSLSTHALEGSYLQWDAKDDSQAIVSGAEKLSLSKLKEEISLGLDEYAGSHGGKKYMESLWVRDSSVIVDADSICVTYSGSDEGGPFGVYISGTSSLTFDQNIFFDEQNSAFAVGFDPITHQSVNTALTIRLTEKFVKGLEWTKLGENDIHVMEFMNCGFFYREPSAQVYALLGSARAGDQVGDFVFQGYVSDLKDLEEGKIALMALSVSTPWGDAQNVGEWPGYSLALVARGAEAPDLVLPEPTTGTLSLLALAGLAARRRRK